MRKEEITRYVRPEDIPLLDRSILEPIVTSVAQEMSQSHPENTVEEWIEILHRALRRGDIVLVIDDKRKRLGLVSGSEPPFSGLLRSGGAHRGAESVDLLNLPRWQRE